jgi:hypothetical protein
MFFMDRPRPMMHKRVSRELSALGLWIFLGTGNHARGKQYGFKTH